MTEPDVAITDYALALECLVFVILLQRDRQHRRPLRPWLSVFFASICAGSLFGGTVHGFFLNPNSPGSEILWPATLLALGVAALASWIMGARLIFSQRAAQWILVAAVIEFALYSAIVSLGAEQFRIAILDYFPAILFLSFALCVAYRRQRRTNLLLAAGALALTLIASILQQLHIGIHPVYFNHNAFYHVLQFIALFLFFMSGRRIAVSISETDGPTDSLKIIDADTSPVR